MVLEWVTVLHVHCHTSPSSLSPDMEAGPCYSTSLGLQKTKPCANTPGPTRWLGEGGQGYRAKDAEEDEEEEEENSEIRTKRGFSTEMSGYPGKSSAASARLPKVIHS
ncbi:unnamed protein product [Pleuronectes platessa]|uniref:Uncharacterized protein n=1 Tax=Pleuronectes platessa TaxID=8262 RepID=A0A9N7Z012_PLEPL|nr:unnamed protein product [Pleuronectes platessa]